MRGWLDLITGTVPWRRRRPAPSSCSPARRGLPASRRLALRTPCTWSSPLELRGWGKPPLLARIGLRRIARRPYVAARLTDQQIGDFRDGVRLADSIARLALRATRQLQLDVQAAIVLPGAAFFTV